MELLKFHGIPWNFYSRCGDSMEFHGIPWNLVLASSSMELSKFHGIPWNFPFDLEKFHGIPWNFWRVPWNSMELWNIDINKFHNWGSVFHCFLYDFMSLYIRQSISSWNIEIFQFQSNFLVPLILVQWRYSILNGGLLHTFFYGSCRIIISSLRHHLFLAMQWYGHKVFKPTMMSHNLETLYYFRGEICWNGFEFESMFFAHQTTATINMSNAVPRALCLSQRYVKLRYIYIYI